uniref:neuropeptide B-like n=1 Tax=Myxine glutinosa TaxID=7769 RepID=UPI00358FE572
MLTSKTVPMLLCLLAASPLFDGGSALYRPPAGPSYYSVGRAAGLLSGIRRSQSVRRVEESPDWDERAQLTRSLDLDSLAPIKHTTQYLGKRMAVCVKDLVPYLQNCEPWMEQGEGEFLCKADVLISMDGKECLFS